MSVRVQYVANKGALKQIANSGDVQTVCLRGAASVIPAATALSGGTYRSDVRPGKFRCHARATTVRGDPGSFWKEARSHALRHVTPRIY